MRRLPVPPLRVAVGLTSVGLALAVAAPSAKAASVSVSAPSATVMAGLTDSAKLTGAPVATGKILRTDGKPVAAGSTVVLQAWPSSTTLAALKDGETVKTAPVGYALTGKDGSFSLRYSDTTTPLKLREADGSISLEVLSDDGGVPVATSIVDESLASASSTVSARFAVAASSTAPENSDLALKPLPGLKPLTGSTGVVQKACTTVKVSTYSPTWVKVGEGYGTTGVTVGFVFKSGASSTVGVGYSVTGTGTFSASGTSSFSSTSTTTFPSFSGIAGRIYSTQYQYAKYRYTCIPSGGQAYQYYNARVTSHYGGASAAATSGAPTANNCATYPSGTVFEKESTTAYTFSGGVGSSGIIGINLNATTGFSSTALVKFTFAATHKLCGSNAGPAGSAKRLVAKA